MWLARILCVLVAVQLIGCHGGLGKTNACEITTEAAALAGAKAAPGLEARYGGVIRDQEAEKRMASVGDQMVKACTEIEGPYTYRLLDSDCINAFSLPGGRVYITQGLYEKLDNDALLAAVIAHEMAHIVSKDHFKDRCSSNNESLAREVSADRNAVRYLHAAGFRPQSLSRVMDIISDVLPAGWSNIRVNFIAESIDGIDNSSLLAKAG